MYWLSMPLCKQLNRRQHVSLLSAGLNCIWHVRTNVMYMVNHASECGNKYYAITVGVWVILQAMHFCLKLPDPFFSPPNTQLVSTYPWRKTLCPRFIQVNKIHRPLSLPLQNLMSDLWSLVRSNFYPSNRVCPRDWGSVHDLLGLSSWGQGASRGHPGGIQLTMCG